MADPPELSHVTPVPALVARFLKTRGVDRVFSLSGGHILPLWDALAACGIRIIDVRHEAAAVHMAQAHAELTGMLGVAIVTAGPGVTNAMTGIANAQIAGVPVLVIGGARPQQQEYLAAFQDLPHIDMVRPITRYARTIHDGRHTLREMDIAVSSARGEYGTPGCAYIEFPTDILRQTVAPFYAQLPAPPLVCDTAPVGEAVEAAIELLCAARRPLLLTGRGATGAGNALTKFLAVYPCAYLDTLEGRGIIAADHPSALPALRAKVMGEADLVITVGCELDYQVGYGSAAIFRNARFLRIGNTPAELRGSRRGAVELPGTPARTLTILARRIADQTTDLDEKWLTSLHASNAGKQQALMQAIGQSPPGKDGKMHPYSMLKALRDVLEENAILILDGGDILSFARLALPTRTLLSPGPLGTIGIGLPYALAASLACPDRQVVLVSGDGSLGFNLTEMDSCVRHGAKFIALVANNAAWNIEVYDQLTTYQGRVLGTRLRRTDYSAVAGNFGFFGKRVENIEDLAPAIAEALRHQPAMIDVVVTNDAVSPDGKAGLAWVPDRQALAAWDSAEKNMEELKTTPATARHDPRASQGIRPLAPLDLDGDGLAGGEQGRPA